MNNILDDLNQRLAARIRVEREAQGWSQLHLAERAGVSRAMIQKIEQAVSSPTATLLARLAGAFGLSMSTLIARAEQDESRLLRRERQQLWQDPATGYLRRHLSPRSTVPLDMVEIILPEHQSVAMPADSYEGASHYIWLLEGELTFLEGEQTHQMATGDCLLLGSQATECQFSNPHPQPCRYLVVRMARAAAISTAMPLGPEEQSC